MQTIDLRPTIPSGTLFVSEVVPLVDDTDVGLQGRSTARYPFTLEGSSDGEEWFPLDVQTMAGQIVNQIAAAGIYRLKAPIVTCIRISCAQKADPMNPFAIVTLP